MPFHIILSYSNCCSCRSSGRTQTCSASHIWPDGTTLFVSSNLSETIYALPDRKCLVLQRISVAARNRAVEKWVTNNNSDGGSSGSSNAAKPRDDIQCGYENCKIVLISGSGGNFQGISRLVAHSCVKFYTTRNSQIAQIIRNSKYHFNTYGQNFIN